MASSASSMLAAALSMASAAYASAPSAREFSFAVSRSVFHSLTASLVSAIFCWARALRLARVCSIFSLWARSLVRASSSLSRRPFSVCSDRDFMFALTDLSRPSMVSNRFRNLSWNWFTFVLTTISFWVMLGEWDRKLRCRRLDHLGRFGLAGGQQRLGAL